MSSHPTAEPHMSALARQLRPRPGTVHRVTPFTFHSGRRTCSEFRDQAVSVPFTEQCIPVSESWWQQRDKRLEI